MFLLICNHDIFVFLCFLNSPLYCPMSPLQPLSPLWLLCPLYGPLSPLQPSVPSMALYPSMALCSLFGFLFPLRPSILSMALCFLNSPLFPLRSSVSSTAICLPVKPYVPAMALCPPRRCSVHSLFLCLLYVGHLSPRWSYVPSTSISMSLCHLYSLLPPLRPFATSIAFWFLNSPLSSLHCPKSSLGNILAQKFSQPTWG